MLLLEAGGGDANPLFKIPAGFAKMTKGVASWGWSTVPQTHLGDRALWYTQAKVIGGGSTINAQLYTRGNAKDYDGWATDAGCAGWSYKDVLPYFKRSEDNQRLVNAYHNYGGPLGVSSPVSPSPISFAFLRAAQEAGVPYNGDFNGAVQDGMGPYQLTTRDAMRSSTASSASSSPRAPGQSHRAHGRADAETRRRKWPRGRRRGCGKRSQRDDPCRPRGDPLLRRDRLAAPVAALRDRTGGRTDKGGVAVVHDLPGVGSNFQDHLDLYAICECTGDHTYDRVGRLDRTIWAGHSNISCSRAGPASSTLFDFGGFWYADREARSPDIQFHLGLGSGIEAGVAAMKNPGVTLNSAFLRPRSRGTVRIASADPRRRAADRSQLLGRSLRPRVLNQRPALGARDHAPAGAEALRAGRTPARRWARE